MLKGNCNTAREARPNGVRTEPVARRRNGRGGVGGVADEDDLAASAGLVDGLDRRVVAHPEAVHTIRIFLCIFHRSFIHSSMQ